MKPMTYVLFLCCYFLVTQGAGQTRANSTASPSFTFTKLGPRTSRVAADTALGSAQTPDPSGTFSYAFGLIDVPRSTTTGVFGISDAGRIVGGFGDVDLLAYAADHGFMLKGNIFKQIDYPGAIQTAVYAVNKSGQTVGTYVDTNGFLHGFKLVGTTLTPLDYPGSNFTVPLAISNAGKIVGVWASPTVAANGFLLSNGVYTPIAVPGAVNTWTEGINKAGTIVGYYLDVNGAFHGFIDNSGAITTFDYPGYPNSYLDTIDDNGVLLGGYGSNLNIGSKTYPWQHGFLYSSGSFSSFDVPFGSVAATEPYTMNNKGEIVGGYVDTAGMVYGFYAKATP